MENELLLPSIRVGIIHAPTFDDMAYLKSIVDAPKLQEKDPTFVFIVPNLGTPHPVIQHLNTLNRWSEAFFPEADDHQWEKVYDRVSFYCTHLIIVFRQDDVQFKEYLKRESRPKRPTQVLMI